MTPVPSPSRHRRQSIASGALLGLLVGAVVSVSVASTAAQTAPVAQESVSIAPGTIFEIIADTERDGDTVNWILLKGGQFLEAQRHRSFSFRPSDGGTYTLRAELIGRDGSARRSIIAIRVLADAPRLPPTGGADAVFGFHPASERDGEIVLPPRTQLLRIDPLSDEIERITLDLNTQADADGDGNPFNDNVLGGTAFRTGRTSLHVWFPIPPHNRAVALGARLENGAISARELSITAGIVAAPDRPLPQRLERREDGKLRIGVEDRGGGLFAFSVLGGADELSGAPLLTHWDFGDGEQSLIDRPLKKYVEAGSFTVRVTLRDLDSSKEVAVLSETVAVSEAGAPAPAAGGKEQAGEDGEERGEKGGSTLGLILKVLLILAVSIGLGIAAVLLLSKLKGKSLQKAVADAEQKLPEIGGEGGAGEPPPMALTESEEVTEETGEEREERPEQAERKPPEGAVPEAASAAEAPPETPAGPTPDWLAPSAATEQGLASAEERASMQPPPQTPPPPPSPPPPPPPAPEAPQNGGAEPPWMQPQPTAEAAGEGPLPPWMQPTDTTPPAPPPEPGPTTEPPPPGEGPTQGPGADGIGWDDDAGQATATGDDAAATQQATGQAGETPEQVERDRERKRRKRQRYRANKRARQKEAKAAEGEAPEALPTNVDGTLPPWLADAQDEPPPASAEPPPVGTDQSAPEGDVKFTISADSIAQENGEKGGVAERNADGGT